MPSAHLAAIIFWHAATRFGEAQILLPAALALSLWMAFHPGARRLALWWIGSLVIAAGLTTVSKIAFIGFGFGVPEINFTGISGHSMFAAVIYPPLFMAVASSRSAAWQRGALVAGYALALLVGVSRVMVGAHSVSEVLAGLALGGGASAAALLMAHMPPARLPLWLPLGLAAWMVVMSTSGPPSRTHDMVTALSLRMSGRATPYTRHEMMREWHERSQAPRAANRAAPAA